MLCFVLFVEHTVTARAEGTCFFKETEPLNWPFLFLSERVTVCSQQESGWSWRPQENKLLVPEPLPRSQAPDPPVLVTYPTSPRRLID